MSSSSVIYRAACPNCRQGVYDMSEAEFEEVAGPAIKAVIDRGDQANAVATAAILSIPGENNNNSSSGGKPQHHGAANCHKCGQEFALVNENVTRIEGLVDLPSSASASKQEQSNVNSSSSSRLASAYGKASVADNGAVVVTTDENASAASQITSILKEEIDAYEETDPLILALQKSKKTNDHVDITDMNTLIVQYRWLIAPVHAFLRVFLFRTLIPAEMHMIGNVTFYLEPKSSDGKKKSAPSSSSSPLSFISSRLFPLAFSPDLAFFELPAIMSVVIVGLNFIVTRHLVYALGTTNGSNNKDGHHEESDNDNEHHGHSSNNNTQWFFSISYLVLLLSISAMYFMTRTILREPGFSLPRNPVLYSDPDDSLIEIAKNQKTGDQQQQHQQAMMPKLCTACHVPRPLRATHCKTNHLCCTEFDHHCTAIGSAVGRRNSRFFGLFVLSSFFAVLLNWVQLLIFLYHQNGKVTTAGWFCVIILACLSGFYQMLTWTWMRSFWGGVLKGLTTKEQNKVNRAGKDVKYNPDGTYELVNSDDPLPIPVPGTAWSRVVLFFTRSTPPSQFASDVLDRRNSNNNDSTLV